ncbi:wax ester/triacylglycerol synthase family O-acyltransferase [Luteipulveratus sp. YIM 133132]|uniref:Diacylglycerol O-acyltransferase n=1 Tax=Luteipulveratus flavus TaxID=3031728 RepID=A0ABT6C1W4_9MICO|nr:MULTISPECIES: wax ester/triacylglycerol synthase family O-acyltransferase [unclassified Luteipulveratus]MDE9367737.1 wax ester/triacylglycerol synthase family O-acyltransferase [Luteipulveratus sp. YIM 133132]MDF8262894.1 wax ester/triacylglycerol synthase family O-acyltransferase [Luteipulveratus sp. YIM 133296]
MAAVVERMSSLDASFLYLEDRTTPMHVGSVLIFSPADDGFDYDRLVSLVTNRIAYVPRYRQRVREIPGGLLSPVWVDDADFDVTYHVRRSALPRPGTPAQLEEFVARIEARRLDRSRPLWELYLVEGLQDGRFAIVTKTHQAMVDGVHAIDIGQVIVDTDIDTGVPVPYTWRAAREPSSVELVAQAAIDVVRHPATIADNLRAGVLDTRRVVGRAASAVGDLAGAVARSAALPAPPSPLNREVGAHRRFVMVSTDLKDFQRIRRRVARSRGSMDVTVHDVILTTIAGALRSWLLTRGESVTTGESVRAMVPISLQIDGEERADSVAPCFVDLPVGESRPTMRLHQVAYSMQQQMESGQGVGARTMANLAGFAPPTLHSLGARVGSAMSRRLSNVVITNVPGPQQPLYAADALMTAAHPVIPLAKGQALAIGLTSYDGGVYFGLNADRDAMPDVDVLGQCLFDALEELREDKEVLA